jgi:hypothetical protein
MATMTTTCLTTHIGETAGLVWRALTDRGPMSLTRLVKAVDAPRDVVMQAVGWLAREDKIDLEETSRGRIITLRPNEP